MTLPVLALTFDADQTLWNFQAVQQLALEATADEMMQAGDVLAVTPFDLTTAREKAVELVRGKPHNLEAVRRHSFELVLRAAGHAAAADRALELADFYLNIRFTQIKLYPEVEVVLARLKPQYKLGLLSNGNTYPERCGLPGTFDAVVLGPEIGIEKPDPRAFRQIASELGVETNQTVHIGDDWDDIAGANAVGAISVFVNRNNTAPAFAANADYEISDLDGLEAILETLGGPSPY